LSRRWFYLIPVHGTPTKLVHRVEPGHLDSLPGVKRTYSAWHELAVQLKAMLAAFRRVAMQYSPNNLIFYVGMVDAGTIEIIRGFGHEIVSSGDLVAQFEAALSDEQIHAHLRARDKIDLITAEAFREIGRRVRNGGATEYDIQQWIMQAFLREGLTTAGDKPVVAVNEHSSIPHYSPTPEHSSPIQNGDFVLLDIWVKENTPEGVFYDITWVGSVGEPSPRQREIFDIVGRRSRPRRRYRTFRRLFGTEDLWVGSRPYRSCLHHRQRVRRVFHSPDWTLDWSSIHANGANLDDLEIRDEREIIPNTCFSVEPGIYTPEFGVRSEVNVLLRAGTAEVTGRIQTELVVI